MQYPELDDHDLDILTQIKNNARMSYSDIGKKVGLSRVAVKNRVKRMEERGVIVAYETRTMRPKTPEEVIFFLDIHTTIEGHNPVIEKLKSFDMLRQIYTTTGDCRIHCIGVAPNSKKVHDFVNEFYMSMDGIRKLECHAAMSTVKDLDRGGVDYVREGEHKQEDSEYSQQP